MSWIVDLLLLLGLELDMQPRGAGLDPAPWTLGVWPLERLYRGRGVDAPHRPRSGPSPGTQYHLWLSTLDLNPAVILL